MNKKGFTLVELLAVIAILAILVIIALPNTMELFNNAKRESFINELKQIHKSTQQQWVNDSMFETNEITYCRIDGTDCPNSLKLSGRQEIDYYVKVNKIGNIVEFYAIDGTYQYANNTPSGLKIEDIKDVERISDISEENVLVISNNGVTGGNTQTGCKIVSGNINTIGSEIVCGTEHFNVLRVTNNNVRMLASKNITLSLSNPVQTDIYTSTYFSTTPYWYDTNSNSYKSTYPKTSGSNNMHYVYDSNSNVYKYVEKYVDTIKSFGITNVSAELLRYDDMRIVPTVSRRDGAKRSITILGEPTYNMLKNQILGIFSNEEIQNYINTYNLQRVWDFNKLTNDDKIVFVAMIYNLLDENGLLNSNEETIQNAINESIDGLNNTYYNWIPEWIYDGKHYYSGESSHSTYLLYPWKQNWDEGAPYDDTTFYGIRPVVIIPASEIKTN